MKKTLDKKLTVLLPPADTDIEQVVLAAMLLDKDSVQEGLAMIKTPEVFYSPANKQIFIAIKTLSETYKPVDILTVTQELRKMGVLDEVGGPLYITTITDGFGSSANMQAHIAILLEKWMRRVLIAIGKLYEKNAYNETLDIHELLQNAQNHISNVEYSLSIKEASTAKSLYNEAINSIGSAMKSDGLTGIPTGLLLVDKLTGGWQNSDLIIIAGRPGMGKTTLVLNMIRNACVEYNRRIAMFSLEMSEIQLMKKLIASEAGLTTSQLVKGDLTEEDLKNASLKSSVLYTDKIIIDDTAGISINELRAKATKLKAKNGIDMIVVDYLQLISDDSKGLNREQVISRISRGLKVLAKELNIPVIALSQLSRSVESRADKKPNLGDLRESGAIEQDADVVCFVYRPEYYKIEEDEYGNPTKNIAKLIFEKHRNGGLSTLEVGCNMKYSKFFNKEDNTNTFEQSRF